MLLTLLFVGRSLAETCNSPQVASQVYSTQDAAVAVSTALVTQFSVKCSNGAKVKLRCYIPAVGLQITIIFLQVFLNLRANGNWYIVWVCIEKCDLK